MRRNQIHEREQIRGAENIDTCLEEFRMASMQEQSHVATVAPPDEKQLITVTYTIFKQPLNSGNTIKPRPLSPVLFNQFNERRPIDCASPEVWCKNCITAIQ